MYLDLFFQHDLFKVSDLCDITIDAKCHGIYANAMPMKFYALYVRSIYIYIYIYMCVYVYIYL